MAYELHRDPRSSHRRIAQIVIRMGRDPVLDVGTSIGQLGRLLMGLGLTVDGIEPDAAAAESAAPYYRSIERTTVESADLSGERYRVIVCADVLEHTTDPAAVLQRLLAAATDDVRFIVSLPNAGHVAARALTMGGRTPQHHRGIFDRTHLQFFTRSTALALMRNSGLSVRRIITTPVPLESVALERSPRAPIEAVMRLQGLAARLAPTLFAYQWIMVAERS